MADEDLIPPMAIAGEGYHFHTTGLTHDERGYPVMTVEAQDKLIRRLVDKIRLNHKDIIQLKEFQIEDADIIVCSYGISARISRLAIDQARREGIKAGSGPIADGLAFCRRTDSRAGEASQGFCCARDKYGSNSAGSRKMRRRSQNSICTASGWYGTSASGYSGGYQGGCEMTTTSPKIRY